MEPFNVSVSISNSNENQKSFKENHEGSLSSLILTLRNIQDKTNNYLTELVDEEKSNKCQAAEYIEKTSMEDSDVELEDDYIDCEIKKELSIIESSSGNVNGNDKRRRSDKKNKKRARF